MESFALREGMVLMLSRLGPEHAGPFHHVEPEDVFGIGFHLRGIGPLSQAISPDDGSVVTYIDGVPQPVYASELAYLDLERIEVLRGPQGTLFGRNSQGGALNITSRAPAERGEASVRLEAGNDEFGVTELATSGPLMPDRLAGAWRRASRHRMASFATGYPETVRWAIESPSLRAAH